MSRYLPYDGLKWLKNVHWFDVNWISEKSPIGYNLEVDLKYSDELHVLHNDFLLAPEKLATSYGMLWDYCKKIADEYEMKVGDIKNYFQIWVTNLIMCFITEIFSCICL